MIYFHKLAITRAFSHLGRKPLSTLLSALVIAIALTLPALSYVLISNLGRLAQDVSGKPQISVFMKNNATPEQAHQIEQQLKSDSRIAKVQFVSRDDALKQLSARGSFADAATMLNNNPLPDALIVEPKGNDPTVFDKVSIELADKPEVAHVQLDSAWVERLHALVKLGQSAVLLLAVLLGATRQFVRRPFLYFGFFQGLLGGLLAWGLVQGLLQIIAPRIQELAQTYGITLGMSGATMMDIGILLAFAAVLGWLGAALSVMRHLHDKPVV